MVDSIACPGAATAMGLVAGTVGVDNNGGWVEVGGVDGSVDRPDETGTLIRVSRWGGNSLCETVAPRWAVGVGGCVVREDAFSIWIGHGG